MLCAALLRVTGGGVGIAQFRIFGFPFPVFHSLLGSGSLPYDGTCQVGVVRYMLSSCVACGLSVILPAQCALDDQRFSYPCASSMGRSPNYHSLSIRDRALQNFSTLAPEGATTRGARRHSNWT